MDSTHHANRVEQAILNESLLDTILSALVLPIITTTDSRPSRPDACTAAGEEKIVIQLVLLDGGATAEPWYRCPFDRNDHGTFVRGNEDVTAKSIGIRFPAIRKGLFMMRSVRQRCVGTHRIPIRSQVIPVLVCWVVI